MDPNITHLIPENLSPGDTIGVISPSDPVLPDQEERLAEGMAYLEAMGFKIKLGHHIHSNILGYAAAPEKIALDINSMFADPEIKAIICTQGGDTANAPLPLMDWDLIKQNPKIFMGLSDITVLLNAIHHRTKLVTFHGNDLLWGFGNDLDDYERAEFIRTLVAGEIGRIPPNRSRKTIRSGRAVGKLLGGNLRCLLKLAGTPFWPDFTNAILFVEAYEISPKGCYTAFHQLAQMGVFEKIRGAIVGYIDSMQRDAGSGPYMEDILLEVTAEHSFPILKMNDFGHNCPNTVLPVGGMVMLDANQQVLEIIAPCTKNQL